MRVYFVRWIKDGRVSLMTEEELESWEKNFEEMGEKFIDDKIKILYCEENVSYL